VLCEKPFAMNARQAAEMVTAARDHQVFLMEALWTRFLPTITTAMDLIEHGSIGDLLSVKADFGFPANPDSKHRLFDPVLGGGALLDIGIYPVFLALLLMGRPTKIHAAAHLGPTGVDEEIGVVFSDPNGRLAHLHASIRSRSRTEAFIYGSTGTLHIHTPWHGPSAMSLLREGEPVQAFHFDYRGEGYYLEAAHVMDCLDREQKESALLPLDFSLQLSGLLDAIRQLTGIRYPGID
ncbi:MAG: gfo/Idh/MocA family oxidoreductase, partial [Wenzhouxiangella sp.]